MIQSKKHRLFYGGISTDRKVGLPFSHAYSRAFDFRKKPGRLIALPGARDIGTGVVSDLVQDIIQVDNGDRYAIGNNGFFYRIDTDNAITVRGKLNDSGGGILFRKDVDELYLTSRRAVSRYGKFSTGPALELDKYKQSRSEDPKAYRNGGSTAYNLATSIDETKKTSFTPDIEPLYSIKVKVASPGTGDWTATLHDDANNVLATSTVLVANIADDQQVEFVFSTPVRLLVKPNARTYHVHITSSDGTGAIAVSNTNNPETADIEVWADRLVQPNNGLHPIVQFLHFTCIGNERYLSVWEPLQDNPSNAEWNRHKLVFPPGYEVCGLATTDEWLCIATELRSTNSNRKFQRGKLFFWNGLEASYQSYIDITEGPPQAVFTHDNMIHCIINGALYAWPGGKNLIKLRTLADTDSEFSGTTDTTEVYPNMMTIRRGTLLIGYPSYTTNQSLEYGVYSWGQREKNFNFSLGLNYSISSGTRFNTGGNLYMGCVRSFGDEMYTSWRDGSDYGLDLIDNTSSPAPNGSWESQEFEGDDPDHEKQAIAMTVRFGTGIPDGYIITPKWRKDWEEAWTYGDPLTEENQYRMDLVDRFYTIDYGFDYTQEDATEPLQVTSVKFIYDDLAKEREW